MPEVRLEIGGRQFIVACEEGEEAELLKAGALLDTEAQTLQEAIGRVPEPRMLLMAGLMLADRTIGLQAQLRSAERRILALEQQQDVPISGAEDAGAAEAVAILTRAAESAEALARRLS